MNDQETNEWIPIPVGASVLFCGAKAVQLSGKRLKNAWHRVEMVTTIP